jgi:serine/threonine-protein kinase
MTTTVFRQVGPYEIERLIGHSGMAMVFLARDSRAGHRSVALKVVPNGPDPDARDRAAAEQRGAELQRTFLDGSVFVPRVFDVGTVPGYQYIAMEHLDGEDLSHVIHRGSLEPRRAAGIAIQLCQFLEEIDRLQNTADGASLTLLHNDLKPTNVRLVSGDRIKVMDFGAAKTLSMSRRVTKNDFYSTPYLSPECLDTGERDRLTDAWALGVILYEMVAGRPPFRADDTRRLEDRIRSRRPPDALAGSPRPLQAVVAKLLAPDPEDRYEDAAAIRGDLERFMNGTPTLAEQMGWAERAADEPPTRRIRAIPDEPPTRRTPRHAPRTSEHPLAAERPTTKVVSAAPAPASRRSFLRRALEPRWLRTALVLSALVVVVNEGCVAADARRLAADVPLQEFAGLTNVWTGYESLSGRSLLGGLGVRSLERAWARQALVLAERVVDNYRTPTPTVREAQWAAAAGALERALTIAPADRELRGTLRYCKGHLYRINGEARRSRGQTAAAQREFAEAITAFRDAAELRPNWPDPFLGLARTFIYGVEDIDRGAEAMKEAQRLGHTVGDRETAQLADGYRARGQALERAAGEVNGMPQQRDFLVRARGAYRQALDHYTAIAAYADAPAHIRFTQRRIEAIDRRLVEIDRAGGWPWA